MGGNQYVKICMTKKGTWKFKIKCWSLMLANAKGVEVAPRPPTINSGSSDGESGDGQPWVTVDDDKIIINGVKDDKDDNSLTAQPSTQTAGKKGKMVTFSFEKNSSKKVGSKHGITYWFRFGGKDVSKLSISIDELKEMENIKVNAFYGSCKQWGGHTFPIIIAKPPTPTGVDRRRLGWKPSNDMDWSSSYRQLRK